MCTRVVRNTVSKEKRMARMRIGLLTVLVAGVMAAAATPGIAQNFPTRVVKIVVPNPAGSGTDVLARMLAESLSRTWSQSVIVENASGTASGNVASAEVAHAPPDGYTLMLCPPGPISTNRLMYKKMGYDPDKWVAISLLATVPYVMVLRRGFDASTVPEFIARAKAKPKTITSASAGPGSSGTLAALNFEKMAGIELITVPYRGLGPAIKDLLAGQVDMMFDTLTTSLPQHRAGTVKIIGVGTEKRVSELPDVPTIAETGLPGFRSITWFGLVAPPGTPDALADKINKDVTDTIKSPQFNERLRNMRMQPVGSTRRDAVAFFADETKYWGKVVKDANITLD
jgi:tripartite-type tricarboxylate transporter receptor subunit TctC